MVRYTYNFAEAWANFNDAEAMPFFPEVNDVWWEEDFWWGEDVSWVVTVGVMDEEAFLLNARSSAVAKEAVVTVGKAADVMGMTQLQAADKVGRAVGEAHGGVLAAWE